jgi:hypothetical protein
MTTTGKKKNSKKAEVKRERCSPGELRQRPALTLDEFASLFGKHKNWAYRLVWNGKVKVIKPLGEMMIPQQEVDRLTAEPVDYETANA